MKWVAAALVGSVLATAASGQQVRTVGRKLVISEKWGTVELFVVAPGVLRLNTHPIGVKPVPTEMMDPRGLRNAKAIGIAHGNKIVASDLLVQVSTPFQNSHTLPVIGISSNDGWPGIGIALKDLENGVLYIVHSSEEKLYGMRGNGLFGPRDPRLAVSQGLFRNQGAKVGAGSQGDGGAPMAYTQRWGVLIDSIDGEFQSQLDEPETINGAISGSLKFVHGSRKDIEAYIILGPPKRTVEVVNDLTGLPPMPPKWSLGFMNSQWGTDENMVLGIVDEYRQKQIPLDAFIFDFDFKAWGEDNFGEWRWNSTNNPGNVGGNKYPDGQSGLFAKKMLDRGTHLVGIMKPRALTQNVDLKPTETDIVAEAHNWWMPKKPYTDYFSHRLANDFDFSKPDLRKWYWQRSKNLFDTGIAGWWNDEADDGFDSLGFFHMQESLFEGQESASNRRVWSLNRNYYLGAQRFAFGTWSGDIGTGFTTMANQRARMLLLTDIGQSHWSMDTGGFNGHPDQENYARWMEFASVVPIMRVHGTFGQRRQPWVYGPIAELAAKRAIEWRSKMLPSFYSWEHEASQKGIGIVRPLHWEFPNNPECANNVDSWMLGDQLLVSPIVEKGQTAKKVYLPAGRWIDYAAGTTYNGSQTVTVDCDSLSWQDMPKFVRSGSILATQPVQQYAGEHVIEEITLDVWPDADREAKFEVYDDDGETRAYKHGSFFSQKITATETAGGVVVKLGQPTGSYRSAIKTYKVRVHMSGPKNITEAKVRAGAAGQVVVKQ